MVYVAFLRGVNVGGRNTIRMPDLRGLLESLGLGSVQTYIRSGNALFESDESGEYLATAIGKAIETAFGLRVPVVLRTADGMAGILADNPFPNDTDCLHTALLTRPPSAEAVRGVAAYAGPDDAMEVVGSNAYLLFRNGLRNSKLPNHIQKPDASATIRNWNTVLELAKMAKAMSDPV